MEGCDIMIVVCFDVQVRVFFVVDLVICVVWCQVELGEKVDMVQVIDLIVCCDWDDLIVLIFEELVEGVIVVDFIYFNLD